MGQAIEPINMIKLAKMPVHRYFMAIAGYLERRQFIAEQLLHLKSNADLQAGLAEIEWIDKMIKICLNIEAEEEKQETKNPA